MCVHMCVCVRVCVCVRAHNNYETFKSKQVAGEGR